MSKFRVNSIVCVSFFANTVTKQTNHHLQGQNIPEGSPFDRRRFGWRCLATTVRCCCCWLGHDYYWRDRKSLKWRVAARRWIRRRLLIGMAEEGWGLRLLACSLRQVLPLSRYRNILINSYFGSTRIKVREAQQKDFVLSSSVSLVDSDNSFICKCRCTGEQFPSLKYLSRSNT